MAGTNLRIKQGSEQKDGELWEWWIWLDGPDDELNKVQRVVYTITDPTFPESSRAISDRSNKFMFKNSGWTEFQVLAQIQNKDGTRITLNHNLQLVKQPLSEKHSGLTLCIPGGREKTTEPFVSESTRAGVLKVEALQSVSVESSRAGSEPIKIPDVPDDTVGAKSGAAH